MTGVARPVVHFNGASHTYTDVEGQVLLGVSSIAKIGEAEDSFGIGAAWGYRLGLEGTREVLYSSGTAPSDPSGETGVYIVPDWEPDQLRAQLQARGLTPWSKRDAAAERGNWTHDALEQLAQDGTVPAYLGNEERHGHARAVLQWYLDYRPSFMATEVQVASQKHGFSGRYDIRCKITAQALWDNGIELPLTRTGGPDVALCLVDLKTSKRIYPTSHFPQLEGYEGASVEMGFPPTDLRLVLNTHPDGTYEFAASYATYDDFLSYLGALRAIKRIKSEDPEAKRKVALEKALVSALPALSRDLALQLPECAGLDAAGVGKVLGGLRKRGLVEQLPDRRWSVVVATS